MKICGNNSSLNRRQKQETQSARTYVPVASSVSVPGKKDPSNAIVRAYRKTMLRETVRKNMTVKMYTSKTEMHTHCFFLSCPR